MTMQPGEKAPVPAEAAEHGEVRRADDPAVLRRRISAERAQLARTVEELAARMDVKSRLRQRRSELRRGAKDRLRTFREAARRLGVRAGRTATAALRATVRMIRQLAADLRAGRARGPRALPPGPSRGPGPLRAAAPEAPAATPAPAITQAPAAARSTTPAPGPAPTPTAGPMAPAAGAQDAPPAREAPIGGSEADRRGGGGATWAG
jgi:hypothetical protein